MIYNDSAIRIAAITDGTSNTFLFGERAQTLFAKFDPSYQNSDGSWNSHQWYDTMVTTYFPPNVGTTGSNVPSFIGWLRYRRRRELPPRRRQLRLLRRLGPVHQELDQLVGVLPQHGLLLPATTFGCRMG